MGKVEKSFSTLGLADGILDGVLACVIEAEKKAKSSREIQTIDVSRRGLRQDIYVGKVMLIPASIMDEPDKIPDPLLKGAILSLFDGEEAALLTSHQLATNEFDKLNTQDFSGYKDRVFRGDDGKLGCIVLFQPAWANYRDYHAFRFIKDEQKLKTLLRHLVFSAYYRPDLSGLFDTLTEDSITLDAVNLEHDHLGISRQLQSEVKSHPVLEKFEKQGGLKTSAFIKISPDEIVEGYLEAALWTATETDATPIDDEFTLDSFSTSALSKAKEDCDTFLQLAGEHLEDLEPNQAGHLFWLNRNGHGSGFWDQTELSDENQTFMSNLCHEFGECNVSIEGDQLELEGGHIPSPLPESGSGHVLPKESKWIRLAASNLEKIAEEQMSGEEAEIMAELEKQLETKTKTGKGNDDLGWRTETDPNSGARTNDEPLEIAEVSKNAGKVDLGQQCSSCKESADFTRTDADGKEVPVCSACSKKLKKSKLMFSALVEKVSPAPLLKDSELPDPKKIDWYEPKRTDPKLPKKALLLLPWEKLSDEEKEQWNNLSPDGNGQQFFKSNTLESCKAVKPTTVEEIIKLSQGTNWSTSNERVAQVYLNFVVFLIDPSGQAIAAKNLKNGKIFDRNDSIVTLKIDEQFSKVSSKRADKITPVVPAQKPTEDKQEKKPKYEFRKKEEPKQQEEKKAPKPEAKPALKSDETKPAPKAVEAPAPKKAPKFEKSEPKGQELDIEASSDASVESPAAAPTSSTTVLNGYIDMREALKSTLSGDDRSAESDHIEKKLDKKGADQSISSAANRLVDQHRGESFRPDSLMHLLNGLTDHPKKVLQFMLQQGLLKENRGQYDIKSYSDMDEALSRTSAHTASAHKEALTYMHPGQILEQFYPELLSSISNYPMGNPERNYSPPPLQQQDGEMHLDHGTSDITLEDYSDEGMMHSKGQPGLIQTQDDSSVPLKPSERSIRGPFFSDQFYRVHSDIPPALLTMKSRAASLKKTAASADKASIVADFLKKLSGEVASSLLAAFMTTDKPLFTYSPAFSEIDLKNGGSYLPMNPILTQGGMGPYIAQLKSLFESINDGELTNAINDAWAQGAVWHESESGRFLYEVFVRIEEVDTETLVIKYKYLTGTKD